MAVPTQPPPRAPSEGARTGQTVKEFAAQVDHLWATYDQVKPQERVEFEEQVGPEDFAKLQHARATVAAWRKAVTDDRAQGRKEVAIDRASWQYIHFAARDSAILGARQIHKDYVDAGGDPGVLLAKQRQLFNELPDPYQRDVGAVLLAMKDQQEPEERDPGCCARAALMRDVFDKELIRARLLPEAQPEPASVLPPTK